MGIPWHGTNMACNAWGPAHPTQCLHEELHVRGVARPDGLHSPTLVNDGPKHQLDEDRLHCVRHHGARVGHGGCIVGGEERLTPRGVAHTGQEPVCRRPLMWLHRSPRRRRPVALDDPKLCARSARHPGQRPSMAIFGQVDGCARGGDGHACELTRRAKRPHPAHSQVVLRAQQDLLLARRERAEQRARGLGLAMRPPHTARRLVVLDIGVVVQHRGEPLLRDVHHHPPPGSFRILGVLVNVAPHGLHWGAGMLQAARLLLLYAHGQQPLRWHHRRVHLGQHAVVDILGLE